MVHRSDIGAMFKLTAEKIPDIKQLPIIIYINFNSLYNFLLRLGSTQEKRLMVDIICLW